MMSRLYSFSHNKTKSFRTSSEKLNQSKKILIKKKCTAVWNIISNYKDRCIHISRGNRKISYKSEFCFILKKAVKQKLKLDIQHVQLEKKSFYLQLRFCIEVHCKFTIYCNYKGKK